jgi:ADP-ribose pyrophosphatase YjhB (NUDIX family)
MKRKVLAYITRKEKESMQLLVFRHVHYPQAGLQVPAGTVDAGEDLLSALWREIDEESGLTPIQLVLVAQVATAPFYFAERDEWQERSFFHLRARDALPDRWLQVVKAGEEDKGMHFSYAWLPLAEAATTLSGNQGDWLHQIGS